MVLHTSNNTIATSSRRKLISIACWLIFDKRGYTCKRRTGQGGQPEACWISMTLDDPRRQIGGISVRWTIDRPDTENWIGCWTKCEFPHEIAASTWWSAVASERETSYRYTERGNLGQWLGYFPFSLKNISIRRGEEHDAESDGTVLLQSAFLVFRRYEF